MTLLNFTLDEEQFEAIILKQVKKESNCCKKKME
jgi:hypothetical protein